MAHFYCFSENTSLPYLELGSRVGKVLVLPSHLIGVLEASGLILKHRANIYELCDWKPWARSPLGGCMEGMYSARMVKDLHAIRAILKADARNRRDLTSGD